MKIKTGTGPLLVKKLPSINWNDKLMNGNTWDDNLEKILSLQYIQQQKSSVRTMKRTPTNQGERKLEKC